MGLRDLNKDYDKTEDDLKALQSVGQIIGELLRQLDDERYIVKASSGPRYVVGCRNKVSREALKPGTRVTLDMTTLTIMRILPREVDPLVYHMAAEDPGNVSYSDVGGLGDQIRQIREVIELPLINPDLFVRVGIKPPKGVLLYGPPGTGKTLLARAIACNIEASFLKVVSSAIVDKYIGESARLIREMFGYAKENQPCVIFMDEIDAIGGRRFSEGTSADREIQRTLMELLNQLDGCVCPLAPAAPMPPRPAAPPCPCLREQRGLLARLHAGTQRPFSPARASVPSLERALTCSTVLQLRSPQQGEDYHGDEPPGRARPRAAPPGAPRPQGRDLAPERAGPPRGAQDPRGADHQGLRPCARAAGAGLGVSEPGATRDAMLLRAGPRCVSGAGGACGAVEANLLDILLQHGDIDYEAVVKLADGFNAADLRNVCTEAGMFAIRAERDYVIEEDLMKAVRKMADSKKLEGTLDYKAV